MNELEDRRFHFKLLCNQYDKQEKEFCEWIEEQGIEVSDDEDNIFWQKFCDYRRALVDLEVFWHGHPRFIIVKE